ncbi:MAG: hypothetical protein GWO08_17160, partial [Gammaproteobacteria bacterium]|nr:hypothetical protein [Gammaproteobacteria bacterium]NIW50156.1 hypothetical protein [Gammaproteobacteria bacterium]NIX01227.1 hypothetical protein [Phycisphaerae bacterium]
LVPSKQGYTFDPVEAEVAIVAANETQDFIGTDANAAPPPPSLPNANFKGAGWLRFLDDLESGLSSVDYSENGVGWNLEYWHNVEDLASSLVELRDTERVYTIIRLDKKLPSHDVLPLDQYSNCQHPEMIKWMTSDEGLDHQYKKVVDNPIIKEASKDDNPVTPIFILNNEPNHIDPVSGRHDEGFPLTAVQYANLYNCYYQHWRVEKNYPHYLFVAGPGQWGPVYDPDVPGSGFSSGWRTFLPEMFATGVLDGADGFAMHVYGYYQEAGCTPSPGNECGDPEGTTLFKPWTDLIMDSVTGNSTTKNKPIIITEYNPGVNPNEDTKPPPLIEGIDTWQNWFDRTYCWMYYGNWPQMRGALYFVDDEDHNRDQFWDSDWWESSLDNHEDRRQHWLEAPTGFG